MIDVTLYSDAKVEVKIDLDENWANEGRSRACPSLVITHGESDKVMHFMTIEQLEALRDQLITVLPMVNIDLGKHLFDQANAMNAALAQQLQKP